MTYRLRFTNLPNLTPNSCGVEVLALLQWEELETFICGESTVNLPLLQVLHIVHTVFWEHVLTSPHFLCTSPPPSMAQVSVPPIRAFTGSGPSCGMTSALVIRRLSWNSFGGGVDCLWRGEASQRLFYLARRHLYWPITVWMLELIPVVSLSPYYF